MTGYHIRIGYNPCRSDREEMWRLLQSEARRIADDPHGIEQEARRLGCPERCEQGCCRLEGYADNYAAPFGRDGCNGNPVNIIDREDSQQIMQLASTDEGFKYHVRRAFVRLLIEAMHRHCIEVSLTVC